MAGGAGGDGPAVAGNNFVFVQFVDDQRRERAGHGAAAKLVDALAKGVAGAGLEIGAVDALRTEKLIGDAEKRRGSVDGEVITGAGTLVPAGHDEVAKVRHVVKVVVGEEELVDLQRID